MKNEWMGLACALAILAGCASRPATGPGSGYGAEYVPLVQASQVPAATYEADVATCQKTARSYTFATPDEHRDALFFLKAVTLGAAAAIPAGWAPTLATTGTTWGLNNGFEYGVYSPQRAAFYARQESAIANCMARKGYLNADPSVAVTWTPTPAAAVKGLRRTGVDTYNAEQVAKASRCTATPFAGQGPGLRELHGAVRWRPHPRGALHLRQLQAGRLMPAAGSTLADRTERTGRPTGRPVAFPASPNPCSTGSQRPPAGRRTLSNQERQRPARVRGTL